MYVPTGIIKCISPIKKGSKGLLLTIYTYHLNNNYDLKNTTNFSCHCPLLLF